MIRRLAWVAASAPGPDGRARVARRSAKPEALRGRAGRGADRSRASSSPPATGRSGHEGSGREPPRLKSSTSEPSRDRAWARTPDGPKRELVGPDRGHVALELAHERALRPVPPHLGQPGPQIAARPAAGTRGRPGSRPGRARLRVAPPVALPGEGEDRVRAGPDLAVDARREMDAQEREARVGDRVDEPADEAPGLRRERVVVAPERDDPRRRPAGAGHRGDAVGLETGAGDDVDRPRIGPRRST